VDTSLSLRNETVRNQNMSTKSAENIMVNVDHNSITPSYRLHGTNMANGGVIYDTDERTNTQDDQEPEVTPNLKKQMTLGDSEEPEKPELGAVEIPDYVAMVPKKQRKGLVSLRIKNLKKA